MPHHTLDSARRDTPEDLSRRERLQRVLARLNRLHEPPAASNQAYGNRTPSPNRQRLYDWAPAHEESREQENELDAILSELRRQQPETHPDILRVLGQSQLEGARQGNDVAESEQRRTLLRQRERQRRESEWVSLRSRAVLQRARQEVAGGSSPSATERMLRYVMDRERSGMSEEEERARGSGWFRPTPRSASGVEEHRRAMQTWENWQVPPPATSTRNDAAPTTSSASRDRDRQERVEAFRRGYLAESMPPRLPRVRTPPMSPPPRFATRNTASLLEHTLQYLSELRSCSRYEDSLSTAMDHGLATKEFFADKHDDFIMDLDDVPALPCSSWLQPGTVFEGHQYASNFNGTNMAHPGPTSPSRVEQINPNFRPPSLSFDHPPGSTRVVSFDTRRHPPSNTNLNLTLPMQMSTTSKHDHWPVRVIIHSIDAEKMTLQGTMEAYDVPQHPSSLSILNPSSERPKAGKKDKPITTYLEGHIIDLKTHSFLTPGSEMEKGSSTTSTAADGSITFPTTTPSTDAENWLKLSPFPSLTPTQPKHHASSAGDTLARLLLSTSTLRKLQREYIFMRWKERCFIHSKHDACTSSVSERAGDQDRGHGLTISGFYYVSLRRADGEVEGLYFDPLSTPYQCLRLRGRGGWGAWGMR